MFLPRSTFSWALTINLLPRQSVCHSLGMSIQGLFLLTYIGRCPSLPLCFNIPTSMYVSIQNTWIGTLISYLFLSIILFFFLSPFFLSLLCFLLNLSFSVCCKISWSHLSENEQDRYIGKIKWTVMPSLSLLLSLSLFHTVSLSHSARSPLCKRL